MADTPSRREQLIHRIRSSEVWRSVRGLVPDSIRTLGRHTLALGGQGTIDLGNGASLKYNLNDTYWLPRGQSIRSYEPELWFIADRLLTPDTLFIDCGANIGLWSCVAASKIKNKDLVIAVEPSDSILPMLRQNHALNNGSFTVLEKAVWNRSGEERPFTIFKSHVSSSLVDRDDKTPVRQIAVKTTSVDDIVEDASKKAPSFTNVVIKLDVEGAERQAMDGAKKTLASRNTLLVYEDHRRDPDSKTTTYFLNAGLHVYYIDPDALHVYAIHEANQLYDIKQDCVAHNFIACRPGSEFDTVFSNLCVNAPLESGKRHREAARAAPATVKRR